MNLFALILLIKIKKTHCNSEPCESNRRRYYVFQPGTRASQFGLEESLLTYAQARSGGDTVAFNKDDRIEHGKKGSTILVFTKKVNARTVLVIMRCDVIRT